jgi:hypothetical protein
VCTDGTCACPEGQRFCGGSCRDTGSDPDHCGGCGTPCAHDQACVDGACTALSCEAPELRCGHDCIDPRNDDAQCGGCSYGDPGGRLCQDECGDGQCDCGQGCTDVLADPLNCGSCGHGCAEGESCHLGRCGPASCPEGHVRCAGRCVSGDDCGAACLGGTECLDGGCVCPAGSALCGNTCRDILGDPLNCGGCGSACGHDEICVDGACQAQVCEAPLVRCGRECVDPGDDAYCGGCSGYLPGPIGWPANFCFLPDHCNPGESCTSNRCIASGECPEGYVRCGERCLSGTSCGQACGSDASCSDGACVCDGGLTRCGDTCIDTTGDVLHCGACDSPCDHDAICVEGTCQTRTCEAPEVRCGRECIDTTNDPSQCGGCFRAAVVLPGLCEGDPPSPEDPDAMQSCPSDYQDCMDGRCITTRCPEGHCLLDGYCISGEVCGTSCTAQQLCSDGVCVAQ